jgi:3-dehydro-L-gulonate 2-dehydrogenase
MTERAIEQASAHGIGLVGLRHTNHWTRPGYFGHHAARRGHGLICWANTPAVMPAWGSRTPRLGNNPIVFAMPNGDTPIVHDMALSQFSIGRLRTTQLAGERLPVTGGFDEAGRPTTDPEAILGSKRPLPVGYWKGSGLALLLDLFAAHLSGGHTTLDRTEHPEPDDVSQVFIAIDFSAREDASSMQALAARVIDDLRATFEAVEDDPDAAFRFPGQGVAERRAENEERGVPVHEDVWRKICEVSDAGT